MTLSHCPLLLAMVLLYYSGRACRGGCGFLNAWTLASSFGPGKGHGPSHIEAFTSLAAADVGSLQTRSPSHLDSELASGPRASGIMIAPRLGSEGDTLRLCGRTGRV
eukprot:3397799-Rhodomonas_salina.3